MSTFRLTCYNKPYADASTYGEAETTANDHIHNCPEGAVPWAKRIEWYLVGRLTTQCQVWVSAAQGQWLDHRIEVIEP